MHPALWKQYGDIAITNHAFSGPSSSIILMFWVFCHFNYSLSLLLHKINARLAQLVERKTLT
jgi:hypothetical protein